MFSENWVVFRKHRGVLSLKASSLKTVKSLIDWSLNASSLKTVKTVIDCCYPLG